MPATKYKQYYLDMMAKHAAEFAAFKPIHDGYVSDRKQWSAQFHQQGQKIVDIIRDWERRLCAGMERGRNAQFSDKLAEKFWGEVKKKFSHIGMVGVKSNFD